MKNLPPRGARIGLDGVRLVGADFRGALVEQTSHNRDEEDLV